MKHLFFVLMNIFVLSWVLSECVRSYIDRHVVKMILETTQILMTAHHVCETDDQWKRDFQLDCHRAVYRPFNPKHPSCRWAYSSTNAYLWLCQLGLAICQEYHLRYHKIHICQSYLQWLQQHPINGVYGPMEQPYLAIKNKQFHDPESVVQSYRNYYLGEKFSSIQCTWKLKPAQWLLETGRIAFDVEKQQWGVHELKPKVKIKPKIKVRPKIKPKIKLIRSYQHVTEFIKDYKHQLPIDEQIIAQFPQPKNNFYFWKISTRYPWYAYSSLAGRLIEYALKRELVRLHPDSAKWKLQFARQGLLQVPTKYRFKLHVNIDRVEDLSIPTEQLLSELAWCAKLEHSARFANFTWAMPQWDQVKFEHLLSINKSHLESLPLGNGGSDFEPDVLFHRTFGKGDQTLGLIAQPDLILGDTIYDVKCVFSNSNKRSSYLQYYRQLFVYQQIVSQLKNREMKMAIWFPIQGQLIRWTI